MSLQSYSETRNAEWKNSQWEDNRPSSYETSMRMEVSARIIFAAIDL